MNTWLLASAVLLLLIGAFHSALGERRIFRPWVQQPPPGVRAFHRQILRAAGTCLPCSALARRLRWPGWGRPLRPTCLPP